MIIGSELGSGLKFFSIEKDFVFNNIASLDIEGEITTLEIVSDMDMILVSNSHGSILILKLSAIKKNIKVNLKEKKDMSITTLSNPFSSDLNNNTNSNFNQKSVQDFGNSNIDQKNISYYTVSYYNFEVQICYKLQLPGRVFTSSIFNDKYIGYSLDQDNYDMKSDPGFGFTQISKTFDPDLKLNSFRILNKSFIINWEYMYDQVLNKSLLVSIGLDKKIKVYLNEFKF